MVNVPSAQVRVAAKESELWSYDDTSYFNQFYFPTHKFGCLKSRES
jgi:hypothetical protein